MAKKKSKKQDWEIIDTPYGQWEYPGAITRIPSNDITMQGVPYPVLGVSDTNDIQMMYPNQDYQFDGSSVTEYPLPEAGSGYKVVRSSERKGKTHKVTGPDGTVKFFGDSKLGQHPKDPARKKAFYARHKKNLAGNPYFRAFARKTWEEGGELDFAQEGLSVADKIQLGLDAAQFVPGLGQAAYIASLPFTTYDVAKDIQQGNYKQAGLDALGYIPAFKAFKYGVKGEKLLDTTSKLAKQLAKANMAVNTTNLAVDANKKKEGGELNDWEILDTAQDGKTILSYLNPKNWGVADYTNTGNFDSAYSTARKAGEKEFLYNGQRFNTRKDTDPIEYIGNNPNQGEYDKILRTQYPEFYKILNRGQNVGNISFEGYSLAHPDRAFIKKNPNLLSSGNSKIAVGQNPSSKEFIGNLIAETAHLKDKNLDESIFNPYTWKSRSEHTGLDDPTMYNIPGNMEYNTHRLFEPGIAMLAYGNLSPNDIKRIQKHLGVTEDGYFGENTYKALVDKYKDKTTTGSEKYPLVNPYMIKDYLKVLSKDVPIKDYKRFTSNIDAYPDYTDNALKNINIADNNSFDTYILQQTLNNRGYKLPKSTKEDGSFDEVLGNETKKALLDYQAKNKPYTQKAPLPGQSVPTMDFAQGGMLPDLNVMAFGGNLILEKYQEGGQKDIYKRPILSKIEEDPNINRSYYDPKLDIIYAGADYAKMTPEQKNKLLAHENYHAYQFKNDKATYLPVKDIPFAKPSMVSTPEIWNSYYNRKPIEVETDIYDFKSVNPSFQFVPEHLIFDKVVDPGQYENPYTMEGEADFYENTGKDFMKNGGSVWEILPQAQGGTKTGYSWSTNTSQAPKQQVVGSAENPQASKLASKPVIQPFQKGYVNPKIMTSQTGEEGLGDDIGGMMVMTALAPGSLPFRASSRLGRVALAAGELANPVSGFRGLKGVVKEAPVLTNSNLNNVLSNAKNRLSNAFEGSSNVFKEITGELTQGKANRESIRKGNEWLENWIQHPKTQAKIENDINERIEFVKNQNRTFRQSAYTNNRYSDIDILEMIKNQSKNFKPGSKEYPLLKQIDQNLQQYLGNKNIDPIHEGNWGVSYQHGYHPILREEIAKGLMTPNDKYGSWISRSADLSQKKRIGTTIHEGTHDWVSSAGIKTSGMRRNALENTNPEIRKDFLEWEQHKLDGKDPVKEMGDERAYQAYLANPTEQHARIMELRKYLGLRPDNVIDEKYAKQIINDLEFLPYEQRPIDVEGFLKVIDRDPKKLSNLFNKFWAVPAVGLAGSAAMQPKNEPYRNGGKIKPKSSNWEIVSDNEWEVLNEKPSYQKGGKVVSEIWQDVTGTPWSEAKKLGLTKGGYEENLAIRAELLKNPEKFISLVKEYSGKTKTQPAVKQPVQQPVINKYNSFAARSFNQPYFEGDTYQEAAPSPNVQQPLPTYQWSNQQRVAPNLAAGDTPVATPRKAAPPKTQRVAITQRLPDLPLITNPIDSPYFQAPIESTKVVPQMIKKGKQDSSIIQNIVNTINKSEFLQDVKDTIGNVKDVEDVKNSLIRGLGKTGLYSPDTEEVEPMKVPTQKPIIQPIAKPTMNSSAVQDTTPTTYYQGKGIVDPRTGTNIGRYVNTFSNWKGQEYIPTKNVGEWKKDKTTQYPSSQIAHYLLDTDLTTGYQHDYSKKMIERQKKGESITEGSTLKEQWLPIYEKLPNGNVRIKYKINKELTKDDKIAAPLRQYKFGDLDWQSDVKSSWNKSSSALKTKTGKETNMIKSGKDMSGYGQFGGGSFVLISKRKNGEMIVRELAGSLQDLKNQAEDLAKMTGQDVNEVVVGYHDVGSWSAKPSSKNKKIGYTNIPKKNSQEFHSYQKDYTGAGLAFPFAYGGLTKSNWEIIK